MQAFRPLAAFVIVAFVAGCATPAEDGRYRFSDGWREGVVQREIPAEALGDPGFWRCTRGTTVAERGGHTFVVVKYQRRPGRTARHLVRLGAQTQVREGDSVYVNVGTCDDAIARRGQRG